MVFENAGKLVLTLVLVALAAGCGSSGEGDDGWEGNWTETGTQLTTCGAASSTDQINALVVFSAGVKANTIQSVSNNCTLVWDVNGTRASLQSDQVCTAVVGGASFTVGWTASTLTRNGGSITGTTGGLANNGCSFNQQVTLTRM